MTNITWEEQVTEALNDLIKVASGIVQVNFNARNHALAAIKRITEEQIIGKDQKIIPGAYSGGGPTKNELRAEQRKLLGEK